MIVRDPWRLVVPAVIVALAGCGTGLLPVDVLAPGSRQWIVTVENQSANPARLMVAEDTMPVGDLVGSVEPNSVAPNTTQDVVITVPAGDTWAVFVNPTNERGPLILAMDVPPDFRGNLPISIIIGPHGEPAAMHSGELGPGWFGQ